MYASGQAFLSASTPLRVPLDDPGGDVLDVPCEVLGGGLGGSHGLLHLELPHQVCRVSVGSVGGVVETHVGHRSVEVGGDDLVLDLLHGLHLVGDDGLDRLDGVVGVGELECVGSQCPLVEQGGLEPSHVDSVSGVSVVAGEVQLSDVVGQDDLMSAASAVPAWRSAMICSLVMVILFPSPILV